MAWIELHQELAEHRKLHRLIKLTGVGRDAALGRLCLLWLWALTNRPDGDISDLDAGRIAQITDVRPRQAAAFLQALVDSGFLDREGERLCIHDWKDYGGRLYELRRQEAERKRRSRQKQRDAAADGHGDVTPLQNTTGHNRTQEDKTGQDLSSLSDAAGARAEAEAMEEYLHDRGLKPGDWLGITPELLERGEALTRNLFDAFCSREPTRADCARVLPLVTRLERGGRQERRWDEDAAGLLRYAFEQANRAGCPGVWSYIERVLLRLHQRGITTLARAEDFDWERDGGGE